MGRVVGVDLTKVLPMETIELVAPEMVGSAKEGEAKAKAAFVEQMTAYFFGGTFQPRKWLVKRVVLWKASPRR